MTNAGWCEGQSLNLFAMAVAGFLVKKFTKREVGIIMTFLSVMTSSMSSMLLAESLCEEEKLGEGAGEEIIPIVLTEDLV